MRKDHPNMPYLRYAAAFARTSVHVLFCLLGFHTTLSVRAQCTAAAPLWDGTSECPGAWPLNTNYGPGVDAVTWSWTPVGATMDDINAFDPVFTTNPTAGGQTYTLTVDLFDINGVLCGSEVFTFEALEATLPGLNALYNLNTVVPAYPYGSGFPVFAICDDPAPSSATFDFTDASQPGAPSPGVLDWGNTSTLPLPCSQTYSGPGLDTITYVATDPQSACVTTSQFGVLLGSSAIPPSVSATPFGGNEHCVGDSMFVEITDATPDPLGTMYVVYTNEVGSATPVDTLFAPLPATYGYVFNNVSCGFSQAPYSNTYAMTLVPSYGCYSGSPNSSVAVPIYVSSSATTSISILPDDTVCVAEPVSVNATNGGQWIDVNGLSSSCNPPNFLWTISPNPPGAWSTLPNALGIPGATPADPTTWISGYDPLSVVFNLPGVYTISIETGGIAACGLANDSIVICVEAEPIPLFVIDPLPAPPCYSGTPLIIGTNNNSVPNATCSTPEYLWTPTSVALCDSLPSITFLDPINGPTSTEPDFVIDGPGIYTIELEVSNEGCGANDVDTTFSIYAAPTLDSIPDQALCDGDSLSLITATADGCEPGALTITWYYMVGGNPASSIGPTLGPLAVDAPQTITVVAASTLCGSTSVTFDVTAQTSPQTVNAAAIDSSLCSNGTLYLLADNLPSATYSWTGPGGFVSSDEDPVVAPTWFPGTYTVTAFLSNCGGAPSSVTINSQTAPIVLANDAVLCADSTSVLVTATGADSYEWFNGPPPAVGNAPTYDAPAGTFTVVGTALNGCTDTATVVVSADAAVADLSVPDTSCVGVSVSFTDMSTGVIGWLWDFGDGPPTSSAQSPSHIYLNADTYYITLTGNPTGPCPVIVTDSIVINESPNVSFFPGDTTVCDSDVVVFINTTLVAPTEFVWWVDGISYLNVDPPPQAFQTPPGNTINIDVLLIGTTPGCPSDTASSVITVNPDPIAELGYFWDPDSSACSPFEVTFTNLSQANTTVIDSLTFGDGSLMLVPFPTGAVVTHTYTTGLSDTTYYAVLYTNNDCGASSDTVPITVLPPLVTAFFNPPVAVCNDSTIQFTSLSAGATSWQWDFGDGNWSTDEDPLHQYANPGSYLVTLDAVGPCGADTWSDSVEVLSLPVPAVTVSTNEMCLGVAVEVTSVTPGMGSYDWDFGDSSGSMVALPSHTYTASGSYTITLVITDQQIPACDADTQLTVVVNDTSVVTITAPAPGCVPFTAVFTTTQQFTTAYYWNFGDSTIGVGPNPVHVYDSAATYTVTLISTNPDSCDAIQTVQVTALPTPIPGFTMTVPDSCASATEPATVYFTDGSSGADVWAWAFDNGDSSTDEDPSTVYTGPGNYTITQTVTNVQLCDSSLSLPLVIYADPVAAPSVITDPACLGQPVEFDNASLNAFDWLWFFGDGGDDTTATPVHTYQDTGTYAIQLWAYGDGACVDTTQVSVTICPSPIAAFDTLWEVDGLIQFTNLSLGATSYSWDFGDDSTSILFEPVHMFGFSPNCKRTVKLIVYNDCACTDTLSRVIELKIGPPFHVANTMTCNGDGTNDLFRPDFPKHLFADVGIDTYRFTVLDRWDHPVFESTDPFAEWDGTFPNGQPVPTGVYNWILEFHAPCYEEGWQRRGHVTLLR